MRTTLKRGIGRGAVVNGDGRAVLPPGVLSPVKRYRQPERVRSPWRVAGKILFVVVAACLATVLGIGAGTYVYGLETLNRTSPVGLFKKTADRLGAVKPNEAAIALVIGYDHRPEDGTSSSRSDTVMLLKADPKNDTISMLSFPRDLNVEVRCPNGGASIGKINSAYALCGPEGTFETVKHLTGLPIHYLIGVNFEGFRQSVDHLGGVWVDVDRRYLNSNRSGGDSYATINLWPGYQRLKGWQALDYVRFRHTDSDIYRVARQQQFAKGMKQAIRSRFNDPRNVFKVVDAMSRNMQIGQAGGKPIKPKRLYSYARFAYELPSGNFFQVKIGGLVGTNELTTDTSNIETAIQEFQHPDTQASIKATEQVLHRRIRTQGAPSPRNVSVVVLNGNGVPGSAGNTSYLLAQKGYRMGQPPQGFQANAPGLLARSIRTQIFFNKKKGARLAAVAAAALFNSADVQQLPVGNRTLRTLSNGAMLTVVVGLSFTGRLTPTTPDRTPPRQPPNVRPGRSETLSAVRAAARWKVGYPLQIPTVIEGNSRIDEQVPYRVYKIGKSQAVRFTFRTGGALNEFWGIQETSWTGAPALEGKNFSQAIGGRQYDFYYDGSRLHMVVLRAGGASYWVVNTLLDSLSNETMLAIAKGLKPLHK